MEDQKLKNHLTGGLLIKRNHSIGNNRINLQKY